MITIASPLFTALVLVAIRMSVVFIFTPIQAIRQLPYSIRFIIVLALSVLLVNNLTLSINGTTELHFITYALAEFSTGFALSLSLYAAFAVLQLAGQLMDNQTGLNALAIFNPGEHTTDPLTSRLLSMLGTLFFFSLDGHHRLIQGLVYSFKIIPLGQFILFNHFNLVIKQFNWVFAIAWIIASPVIISSLLIEICCAIVTRNMPQVNSYFLALPFKILCGFLLLSLVLDHFSSFTALLFHLCFHTWNEVMT